MAAAGVLWSFCTLQHLMFIEYKRKTFPFGSGLSLHTAPNGQQTSGQSISVIYAFTDQWRCSSACISLQQILAKDLPAEGINFP